MSEIVIYTDGSCLLETGVGGWGYVGYRDDEPYIENAGHSLDTTNNRMELQAVIAACLWLSLAKGWESATIITDSKYVRTGLLEWIHGWKALGWRTKTGAVKNLDLWREAYLLYYLTLEGRVDLKWVKGHSGVEGNERADRLADQARKKLEDEVLCRKIEVLKTRIEYLEDLRAS
jgi:ribonuclease HI